MKIRTSQSAFGRTPFWKILQRRITVGSAVLVTLVACVVGSTIAARAQEERPQIIPGERRAPKKKDSGPRAVGVLQMTANGKASLVPIAILINGKFWDASAYKADPVPMSLDSGTVYEAERAGNSLGLFTVSSALHRNSSAPGALATWIGTGAWHPNGSEAETKSAKAEPVPVGIDTSEGPPRLTRDPSAKDKPPDSAAPSSGNAPAGSNAPSTAPKSSGPSGSSDEPPRLSKPASAPEPPADSGPGAKPSGPDSEAKPGDAKASESKAEDKAKVPASDSGASEGNRPRLRRGKPPEPVADEDVPGYSKVGAKSKATADLSKIPVATQGDMQLIPAISDARGPEIHSFVFQWLKGEEDDRRKQMTDLAKEQLRGYIAARAKAATSATTGRSGSAKNVTQEPVLENVHMVAYDLWLSNQPVMVLTAEGHMPPPAAGVAHSEVESEMQYSVVLVAYPDIYGNLHKLHVGITDKFHLDMTPRLELIDALDADGDNRGELLFRETSDQGTGWVIYRPTADKLWKMFDSLSPQ
ncbi:MAG: hypothetical protein LAP86_20140 [Acidobacteriia bacterium]|nr:hypothetical protein [Terriglobia bacterium]